MPLQRTVYVCYLCLLIASINMNVGFYSHHSTENNFSRSPVKSQLQYLKVFLLWWISLLYLTLVISPPGKLHLLASMTLPLLINFEIFRLFLFCLLHGLLSHHFSPLKCCSSSEFSPGPATIMILHCLWAFSSILMASTTIYRLVIPKSIGLVPNFRLPGWRAESIWMDIPPRCPP